MAAAAILSDATGRCGPHGGGKDDATSDRLEHQILVEIEYTHVPVRDSLRYRYLFKPFSDQLTYQMKRTKKIRNK